VINIVTRLAFWLAISLVGLAASPSSSCFGCTKFKEFIRFLHRCNEFGPIRPGGHELREVCGRDSALGDYFERVQEAIERLLAVPARS
jgi:hypothetical protein